MAKLARGLVLILALVAYALALSSIVVPSEEHFIECSMVGIYSGASGCSENTIDCEWCIDDHDPSDGICAPQRWCRFYDEVNGDIFVADDPIVHEKMFRGIEFNHHKHPRYASFHDSHYCEFKSEPWPVDRYFNQYWGGEFNLFDSPCNEINNYLFVRRNDLDLCLVDLMELDPEEDLDWVFTPRRKECLRYMQTLQCSLSCPEYGVAFNGLRYCSNVCDRLYNLCDEAMFECTGFSAAFDCADKGDTYCYDLNEIPQSGRFEYDECYWGDIERCRQSVDKDCVILEGDLTEGDGFGCCDWQDGDHAVWYQDFVVEPPQGNGQPCEAVVQKQIDDRYLVLNQQPYYYVDNEGIDCFEDGPDTVCETHVLMGTSYDDLINDDPVSALVEGEAPYWCDGFDNNEDYCGYY